MSRAAPERQKICVGPAGLACGVMHRHELTDEQWLKVQGLIPRYGRVSKLGDRSFINAVIFVLKTGAPWRWISSNRCWARSAEPIA